MTEQTEPAVSIVFTQKDLNLIFAAFQELPFKIAEPFIRNIQEQIVAQTNPAQGPVEDGDSE